MARRPPENAPADPSAPLSTQLPEPRKAVIGLDRIDFSPFNKRTFHEDDPHDLALVENLRALGRILEPLLLRPEGDRFRLIAGERRVRCGRVAGIAEADAMIYDVDEPTANLLTFVENFHRRDLHYLEEAAAVAGLMASGCSQEMIAAQIGRPVKWVALRAHLTNLSPRWREIALNPDPNLAVRLWNPSLLEVIALLSQPAQEELFSSHAYLLKTEPTLALLKRLVAESTLQLTGAPWRLEDETLSTEAGACSTCPLRSSIHPTLFADLEERTSSKNPRDRCLNPACWKGKLAGHLARREAELRQKHPDLVLLSTGPNRQTGVLLSWAVRPAKRGQPAAVPALVLDGSDQGKMRWVFPPESPKPVAGAATPTSPELSTAPVPGQRAKSSLAERQAAKDRQRKLLATQTLATAVAEAEQTPPLATVLALACVFGTEHTLSSGSYLYDGSLEREARVPLWTSAEELAGGDVDPAELASRLWRRVRPVLLKRTANMGTPQDVLRAYEEACKLAALVGIDSAQHLQEATLT
ncbi:MAG: ParB N-terminal domain-containing protein, partial [Acidobacteriota bacterium]|nr:ParB N-terminal domain-containing protein [Acidobacteriota bacterium]